MFNFKTLGQLLEMTRASFRANMKGSDASIWPNNVYVSAKVISGMIFEAFGFARRIEKEIFAHTAPDIESLTKHGIEYDMPQNPARASTGNVVFAVPSDIIVQTGAVLQRSDGVQIIVTSGGALASSGTLTLPATAAQVGKITTTAPNTPLQIMSGVTTTGDPPTCAVDANGMALGLDVEDIESYRARILFRKRNPPHGGAPADYVQWAGQVAGVSFYADQPTVFVERLWSGPGTIRVFPLMYDLYPDGIPSTADLARVAGYFATVQPAGAQVTVAAPARVVVDVVVSGLTPNTTDVQEAVKAELADTFKRLSRPAGTDAAFGSMPYLASPFSFSLSWIWQAVANATGEQRHRINSPAADIALAAGQMAVLGTVTFV